MNTAPGYTNVKKEIVKWVYVGNEININLEENSKKKILTSCCQTVIISIIQSGFLY